MRLEVEPEGTTRQNLVFLAAVLASWAWATFVCVTVWDWHVVSGMSVLFGVSVTSITFWQMVVVGLVVALFTYGGGSGEKPNLVRNWRRLRDAVFFRSFTLVIAWALQGVWV